MNLLSSRPACPDPHATCPFFKHSQVPFSIPSIYTMTLGCQRICECPVIGRALSLDLLVITLIGYTVTYNEPMNA